MSKDKRSVTTDALMTLGTIITEGERDAIHLAVEPVIANETLFPGQHIGLIDGKATSKGTKMLGIVDPFITGKVFEGDKFWLIVYPRQITSLRHVWEHPDFETNVSTDEIIIKSAVVINTKNKTPVQISEEWLRSFADSIDEPYEHVMRVADSHQDGRYGDYIIQGGRFEGESTPDEFWDHYSIVRGVDNPNRSSFFSCSC